MLFSFVCGIVFFVLVEGHVPRSYFEIELDSVLFRQQLSSQDLSRYFMYLDIKISIRN